MKIPQFILAAFLVAMLGLEGWSLSAIVDLKAHVAAIEAVLHVKDFANGKNQNQNEEIAKK